MKDDYYWNGKSRTGIVVDIIKGLRPYVNVKATVGSEAKRDSDPLMRISSRKSDDLRKLFPALAVF